MKNFKKTILVGLIVGMSMFGTGCAKKEIVEIKPNEVGYESNNFGDDSTQAFDGTRADWASIRSKSKMVIVNFDRISTGSIPILDSKKIPEKKIIVVSQGIVSREWVADEDKGTSTKDQSLTASSNTGTAFNLGVTISGKIKDTDTYISIYGIDPRATMNSVRVEAIPLEYVFEKTIKPYIQGELAEEFGKIPTDQCEAKKNQVIRRVEVSVKERFANDGIEIITFNMADQLSWHSIEIQEAINETAKLLANAKKEEANQEVEKTMATTRRLKKEEEARGKANIRKINSEAKKVEAENDRLRQAEVNAMELEKVENATKIDIEKAQSQVKVANEKAKAIDSELRVAKIERFKIETKAIDLNARAILVRAEKWDGSEQGSKAQIIGADSVVGTDGSVRTLQLSN